MLLPACKYNKETSEIEYRVTCKCGTQFYSNIEGRNTCSIECYEDIELKANPNYRSTRPSVEGSSIKGNFPMG